VPGDIDAQARWRATRAKLLARSGQFPAAQTLLDEAAALVSPTSWAVLQAEILMARAEVNRLAGEPEHAARPACAPRCASIKTGTPPPSRIRPRPPSPTSPATPAPSRPKRLINIQN
jgi:hypothetical protein